MVTDDLKDMLIKLGIYGNSSAVVPMFFRGELVRKNIMTTNMFLLKQIMQSIDTNDFERIIDMETKPIELHDKKENTNIMKNKVPMNYRQRRDNKYSYTYENSYRKLHNILTEQILMIIKNQ